MVEREGKLLACAMLRPLGQSDDGVGCAEIAAFCVHPAYRGSGRGDSLLDFLGVFAMMPTLACSLRAQPQAIHMSFGRGTMLNHDCGFTSVCGEASDMYTPLVFWLLTVNTMLLIKLDGMLGCRREEGEHDGHPAVGFAHNAHG